MGCKGSKEDHGEEVQIKVEKRRSSFAKGPAPAANVTFKPDRSSSNRKTSLTETLMVDNKKGERYLEDVYDISSPDLYVLGEGMSGKVQMCRKRMTDELFALKTLSVKKLLVNMEELRQEIDILKRLDHPNIVKVYETFEDEEAFHVVMELCSGGQLIQRMKENQKRQKKAGFNEDLAARLLQKMITSIMYCHEHNVCHRDVKLDNFVYESDGDDAELKLIDFGLSHVLEKSGDKMKDRVGTLTYMAPEVLNSGLGGYTSACDMWSMGVVAYMLLSGRRPFHHADREEKKRLVREGKASFESEVWGRVSVEAQQFVRSLLQVDPHKRHTAKQALADPWMMLQQQEAPGSPRGSSAEERRLNSLVLHSLQDFMHKEALHKVALEVVAFTAPPASFDELRKLFKMIDTDNSGTISYDELKTAMEKFPEIPEVQVRRIFEAVDLTHKGEVDYNSFLAATYSAQQDIGEPTLRTAFAVLDRDDDGFITKEDLMQTVGQACSEAEIDEMLAEIDVDTSRIHYVDFQRLMTHPTRASKISKHIRPTRGGPQKSLSMSNIDLSILEPSSHKKPTARAPPRRLATEPKRLSADRDHNDRAARLVKTN